MPLSLAGAGFWRKQKSITCHLFLKPMIKDELCIIMLPTVQNYTFMLEYKSSVQTCVFI